MTKLLPKRTTNFLVKGLLFQYFKSNSLVIVSSLKSINPPIDSTYNRFIVDIHTLIHKKRSLL